MKKELVITFFIAILLVFGVSFLNRPEAQTEQNYFFVDTPLESYNQLMSSYQGFPFVIKCNNDQKITIKGGVLKDENGIIEDNIVSCDTVIYWSDLEKESVTITFESSDFNLKPQTFTLLKNENNDYYLEKMNTVNK